MKNRSLIEEDNFQVAMLRLTDMVIDLVKVICFVFTLKIIKINNDKYQVPRVFGKIVHDHLVRRAFNSGVKFVKECCRQGISC